ncbi:hypothetical protein FA95DRAFT_952157 [Auriscalpium vulgare]|uniref:Uncharacterized protein n=1 Tax=Auriscalpium vulgare TaxID=40419 RepID=A0ACB8R7L1_9AGAM|nr:hypothetical protein FA95DRAFT_952157 [Auriscalpium vulgare]
MSAGAMQRPGARCERVLHGVHRSCGAHASCKEVGAPSACAVCRMRSSTPPALALPSPSRPHRACLRATLPTRTHTRMARALRSAATPWAVSMSSTLPCHCLCSRRSQRSPRSGAPASRWLVLASRNICYGPLLSQFLRGSSASLCLVLARVTHPS